LKLVLSSGFTSSRGGITDDKSKLATLIGHWIEHNEGHRQSYLEWRAKLDGQELPLTAQALDRIAQLTEEMNRELATAAQELTGREGGPAAATSSGEHSHSH
jgi:hypothetical protein